MSTLKPKQDIYIKTLRDRYKAFQGSEPVDLAGSDIFALSTPIDSGSLISLFSLSKFGVGQG